jgi:TatD DNase family protein
VIDTHAHLDALDDPAGAVTRARDAGVSRILSVGTDPRSWDRTLALAEENEGVFAIVGLHPHEAGTDVDFEELERFTSHDKVVAVGEIGLDYYRDYAPHDAQSKRFILQLGLAKRVGLPVVIHNRSADDDTVAILRQWFDGTVVLHCFSSPAVLGAALEDDWYVSFAGNVTYKNAEDLREAARQVPRERLLVETDCPYLSPQPVRGKTNEPGHVVYTVAALADARGEDPHDLGAQIDANASTAFGLP